MERQRFHKIAVSAMVAIPSVLAVAFAIYVGMGIDYAKHRMFDRMSIAEAQGSNRIRSQFFWSTFDIASTTFVYCDTGGAEPGQVCTTGSAAGDGWIQVTNEELKAVEVEITTINATSIEFIIQARLSGATTAAQIWPATGNRSETTTGAFIVQVPDAVYEMRVGVKVTGDVGAQSVSATLNSFAPDAR